MEKIEVAYHYDDHGTPVPTGFTWQGRTYRIIDLGRQWDESGDHHILCMVPGEQVYELIFHPVEACWSLGHRPPQTLGA